MAMKTWSAGDKLFASDLMAEFAKVQSNFFPATAGENVTANKPGYINLRDGKAYTAHGYDEDAEVTHTLFSSISGAHAKMCRLNSTYFLVLGHASTTVTVYLVDRTAGTTTNATVTTSATSFIGVNDARCAVARIDDSKFIVFFERSNKVYYRTGSISGTTITMDTETDASGTFTSATSNTGFECDSGPGYADGKCLLSYWSSSGDSNNAVTLRLYYVNIGTDSATVNQSASGNSSSGGAFFPTSLWSACAKSETGTAIALGYCYGTGGDSRYIVVALDIATGDSNSYTPQYWANSNIQVSTTPFDNKPYLASGFDMVHTFFSVRTEESSAIYDFIQHVEFGFYTTKVTTLTSRPVYRNSGTTQEVHPLTFIGNANAYVIYYDPGVDTNNTRFVFQRGKMWHGPYVGSSQYPNAGGGYCYEDSKDSFVVIGGTKIFKVYLPTPFDGFIQDTVTSGNTTYLKRGYVSGLSSLTANRRYYLDDDYSAAGDLNTRGTIPIGRSISTTEIMQDQDL